MKAAWIGGPGVADVWRGKAAARNGYNASGHKARYFTLFAGSS
jgi:hypothetical protein